MNIYGSRGEVDTMMRYYHSVKAGKDKNSQIFCTAMNVFAKRGQTEQMFQVGHSVEI
jgi:hypothetical protein